MNTKKLLGSGAVGGAMLALGGVAAANAHGRRLRRRTGPATDPIVGSDEIVHHQIDTADGASIHVAECGSGPRTLVLLHGVTLQWWVWSALIHLAKTDHRVLAWDMRGHGRSHSGSEGVTLDAAADDLAVVLETLDVRNATVIGHSLGGMTLGVFVHRHAEVSFERIDQLVFLSTSAATMSIKGLAGGLGLGSAVLSKLAFASIRRPRLAYPWKDTGISASMVAMAFGDDVTGPMIEDVRQMLAECPPLTLAEAGASIAAHDVRATLAEVKQPTTVIVGSKDRLTPLAHARQLATTIPGAELIIVAGMGHQMMQEDPARLISIVRAAEAAL